MVVASYRKGIKITDVWFQNDMSAMNISTDIIRYYGMDEEKVPSEFFSIRQNTLLTDLSVDEELLRSKIKSKGFKGDIRKSCQDEIEIRYSENGDISGELLQAFSMCYSSMFASKGIKNQLNIRKIHSYIEVGCLVISCVYYESQPIVFHAYVKDSLHSRFLYSCSDFRKDDSEMQRLIGRANKRLHWEDWMYLKQQGIVSYDWGGINSFLEPNSIDQFKMHFGGQEHTYCNVFVPVTSFGKVMLNFFEKRQRRLR